MAVYTNKPLALDAGGMDLEATLFCGQSFSWCATGRAGTWRGTAGTRAVEVRLENDVLLLSRIDGGAHTPQDADFWRHYFALDVDYLALLARFAKNPTLAKCVAHAPGIRVLNQPFFDTLMSFILSQNNNIARITGIVERLREGFGPLLDGGVYAFPLAEDLAGLDVEDLAPLRAGFRAKYLLAAAKKVASGEVSEGALAALGDDDAQKMLTGIYGVGPKVANCVLLFSLGRSNVVPMDVWIKRAMAAIFPDGMPAEAAGYEGVAQQYIFGWARENLPRGG